jgi:hypothetical protein
MSTTYQFPEPTTDTNPIYMKTGDSLNLTLTATVNLCCDHPEYFTPRFPSGLAVSNGRSYEATSTGTVSIWVVPPGQACALTPPIDGRTIHITSSEPFAEEHSEHPLST